MDIRLSKQFQVRNYEVDQRGFLSPIVLLNILQEVAGNHASMLGVAVTDLHRHGLTWVLSRLHLQIRELPRAGKYFQINSWPSTRDGHFSCREFEACMPNGEVLAMATSSWAVIDLSTRRPVRLNEQIFAYPLDPHRAIDDSFTTLPCIESVDEQKLFTVRRADLDMNCHVNNVIYTGWLLETIADSVFEQFQLASIELSFRAEAFADEEVLSEIARLPGDALNFAHRIVAVADGRELVRARTNWIHQSNG